MATLEETSIVPVEAYVRYHGSKLQHYGFYTVAGHDTFRYWDNELHAEVAETRYYLVAYEGSDTLRWVRRGSFTVLPADLTPDDYVNYRSYKGHRERVSYRVEPERGKVTRYAVSRINPNGQGWRVAVYDNVGHAQKVADRLNESTEYEVH